MFTKLSGISRWKKVIIIVLKPFYGKFSIRTVNLELLVPGADGPLVVLGVGQQVGQVLLGYVSGDGVAHDLKCLLFLALRNYYVISTSYK